MRVRHIKSLASDSATKNIKEISLGDISVNRYSLNQQRILTKQKKSEPLDPGSEVMRGTNPSEQHYLRRPTRKGELVNSDTKRKSYQPSALAYSNNQCKRSYVGTSDGRNTSAAVNRLSVDN